MNENEMNQPSIDNENMHPQEERPEETPPQREMSMGAVLGSIVVVIILLVAAFYLWGNRADAPDTLPIDEPTTTAEEVLGETDPQTESLKEQSSSDELDSIEADLEDTDLDDLIQELETIDDELGL
ncbi:MAG: hypothetical protein KAR24_01975 [Candidatus Pacebacteria bacterium]|nr:hypothetical protein [Candidatus Paceibacterota bacterium]